MSRLLLDTNVHSEVVTVRPNVRIHAWVREQKDEDLFLSVVTIGEIRKGIDLLAESKRRSFLANWLENELVPVFYGRVLAVTPAIANRWGTLSARRHLAGRPLGMSDGLIAATALEHGLTLVTRNVRDFDNLGVEILNPWETASIP